MRNTYRRPIIPERNVILTPLEPGMYLLGGGDHVREVLDNSITLSFGDTNDLSDEARVEEECVPAGDRVGADERVFGGDWFAADGSADGSRVTCLHVGRVEGC